MTIRSVLGSWFAKALGGSSAGHQPPPLPNNSERGGETVFLTVAEQALRARLFEPDFTLEEGLALYRSVVESGRQFPAAWERRVVELGLQTYPRRHDLKQLLHDNNANAGSRLLLMAKLTHEEVQQVSRLYSGWSTLADGLQLYNTLTTRGIPFPMDWEEKILELCVAEDPERSDTLERYRQVLLSLGKPVPPEVEARYAALAKRDEYSINHQQSASQYHQKTGLSDTESEFRELAEQVRPFTMTSFERMYALFKAIEFIEVAKIPGDIVECGVWRGGSMMLAARLLVKLRRMNRNLYLFDTYEGLPKPDEAKDVDIWGNRAIDGWLPKRTDDETSHWARATIDEVRANLLTTGYPPERLHFVKGMVEDTLPHSAPDQIALLRLDTDWYASTKHEMQHLFPRLVVNGVLIIDDYGHFAGARRAVDEYLAERALPLLLHRIDYSGRIALKITQA